MQWPHHALTYGIHGRATRDHQATRRRLSTVASPWQELYYRHLYARCAPDLRQRCESWDNYCDLFGVLLHSNVNMQLPNIWLWDMIDEFIYQFQVR